jgi:hypothetical protein
MSDTKKCFYEPHQERVKQRCGGDVIFGVRGFFTDPDNLDLLLCYEHKKWWNKVVSDGCGICRATKMPSAQRL